MLVIGCKWSFLIRYEDVDKINENKAHLGAKGLIQGEDFDYTDTITHFLKLQILELSYS